MPPVDSTADATTDLSPSSAHAYERSYIARLTETYPALLPLLEADMVVAENIMIDVEQGSTEETSVVGCV